MHCKALPIVHFQANLDLHQIRDVHMPSKLLLFQVSPIEIIESRLRSAKSGFSIGNTTYGYLAIKIISPRNCKKFYHFHIISDIITLR